MSETAGESRFLPGQLLGQKRYRIVSLLGRGGTGEVYRADDLVLGQRVALKFLPETREQDEVWVRRFRHEVRIAREISHPHVCRVHDVGQHEGVLFLSMECIEGEDLQRLLSRVGRLSPEKALDLAHQLCSALTAIHDQGLLHRDLKPSNVMIDDRGLLKLLDFGLMNWIGSIRDPGSGTLPYMAPEQLATEDLTARTDVYALGLVLYELFTGQRAFEDDSRTAPAAPRVLIDSIDPRIEKLILHCLESDPADRPASAREVAEALPASEPAADVDPFPPPALFLRPAEEAGLGPMLAFACLLALAGGLLVIAHLGDSTHLTRFLDAAVSPRLLAERARDTLAELGFRDLPRDRLYGFAFDERRLAALDRVSSGSSRERELARGGMSPVSFWFRKSPRRLVPWKGGSAFRSYEDPPATTPGTVGVQLDPQGRLRRLDAVLAGGAGAGGTVDWERVLAATGLATAKLRRVRPALEPAVFADHQAAWKGAFAGLDELRVRVEAAAYRGRPVSIQVIGPAPRPAPGTHSRPRPRVLPRWLARPLLSLWLALLLGGGAVVARRNLRSKRADRKAALRLAVGLVAARLLVWLLGGDPLAGGARFSGFWAHLAWSLFCAGLLWLLYVALEPLLRRHWPQRVESWVRLMHGRWRDPRVGRDLLLGVLCGVAALLWAQVYLLAHGWLGRPVPGPDALDSLLWQVQRDSVVQQLEALRSFSRALAVALHAQVEAVLVAFSGAASVFLLWFVPRRPWVAVAVALPLGALLLDPATGHPALDLPAAAVAGAAWLAILLRAGLLPAVVATGVAATLGAVPLTLDLFAWYGPGSAATLLAVFALGVFGLSFACGGRRATDRPWNGAPPQEIQVSGAA